MFTPNLEDCHQPVVELEHVSFSYRGQQVISDLSFSAKERDFVGIIGSNGAGKSTLLRMIVGLLPAGDGQIRLFGQPIRKFKDWERIGYVPQKNAFNPLFPATVREVVMSGLYNNKTLFRRVGKSQQQKCDDAMEVMGIESIMRQKDRGAVGRPAAARLSGEGDDQSSGFAYFGRAYRRHRRQNPG